MNQYLLLRDNKQTGPYSFEELVKKGLKKYDLVWLEGRSAAWRYPSEFDELKPYSPDVEEQPYDRFYKKPGEQGTAQQQPVVESNQQVAQPVTVQTSENSNKKIFVTMPAGKTQVAASKPKEEVKQQPVQQPQQKKEQHTQAAKGTYLISEDDDEANSALLKGYNSQKKEADESNSGFLNDYEARKAAYTTKKTSQVTEQQPVQPVQPAKKETPVAAAVKNDKPAYTASKSSAQKKDLKQLFAIPAKFNGSFFQDNKTLTRSLLAACLILGGVVIGLIINSGKQQGDSQVLETLVKEIREQNKDKDPVASPNNEKASNKQQELSDNGDNNDNINNYTDQSTLPNSPESPARHALNKKEGTTQQKQPVAVPVSNPSSEAVEPQPAVNEPKEKVNQDLIEKARKNIYDLVGIEASQYKVGLLGGISELDITISNNSLYALDQVDVEVKYFGPERKLVRTQTIKFSHVPAGKQRTLEVPRTNRGISIDYSITGINSKALGLAQAGY